jgi:hypothetical protein
MSSAGHPEVSAPFSTYRMAGLTFVAAALVQCRSDVEVPHRLVQLPYSLSKHLNVRIT